MRTIEAKDPIPAPLPVSKLLGSFSPTIASDRLPSATSGPPTTEDRMLSRPKSIRMPPPWTAVLADTRDRVSVTRVVEKMPPPKPSGTAAELPATDESARATIPRL